MTRLCLVFVVECMPFYETTVRYWVEHIETLYIWYPQELFVTTIEFFKLEKIEFGGIKGKMLSGEIVTQYEEFQELFKVFTEKSYDCLDPTEAVRTKMFSVQFIHKTFIDGLILEKLNHLNACN